MDIVIRTAVPADMAAVDALLSRTFPKLLKADYPPSVLVTALPLISRARPELFRSKSHYVAETREGVVLGAGGWSRARQSPARGHVRQLVTDDRYLRQGIARLLMTHALSAAAESGIAEMVCWSTYTAEPFYSALGFETVGDIAVPLAPGISFPAIDMRKSL